MLRAEGARLYGLLLRLTLRRDVAEDLLQDLFVRLSRSGSFVKAERPGEFAARAAVNLAMDWRRREARGRVRLWRLGGRAATRAELELDVSEEVVRVLDAAAALRGRCREAFVLRFVHGASYEAVGAALGRTPHQARALCGKAVIGVRKRLASEGQRRASRGGRPCTT